MKEDSDKVSKKNKEDKTVEPIEHQVIEPTSTIAPSEILDEEFLEIRTRESELELSEKEIEVLSLKKDLAIAKRDVAKLNYENYVLKVYIKYRLTASDSIKVKKIIRGSK